MKIIFWRRVFDKMARKVLAQRKKIRHIESSIIYSPNDVCPNNFLVNLFLQAAQKAWSDPILIPNQQTSDFGYLNIFPGEHYRLLRALTMILNAKQVIEVGTYTGLGTIAMMQGQTNGHVLTYDLIPWQNFDTNLSQEYFDRQRVIQRIADLSDLKQFEENLLALNQADIIFVDGPKDSIFEYKLIPWLSRLAAKPNKLLILDDIRFVNMIDLWVRIRSPKLDVTSFGHWSGTGLVDISQPLQIDEEV